MVVQMRLYLLTDACEVNLAIIRLVEIELHGNKYYQISKSFSVITQERLRLKYFITGCFKSP